MRGAHWPARARVTRRVAAAAGGLPAARCCRTSAAALLRLLPPAFAFTFFLAFLSCGRVTGTAFAWSGSVRSGIVSR